MKYTIITLALILALALSCVAMAEEVPGTLPTDGTDAVEAIPTEDVNDAAPDKAPTSAPSTTPTDDLKAAMDAYRAAKQDKAVDDLEEELDGYVEEGSLTQEQADLILNSVKERIAAKNGECPSCGYKLKNNQFPGQHQFPGQMGGKQGGCQQNQCPGVQGGQNQMPGQKQYPGQQRGNQVMPQDGQRPDAQSGATPRNNGKDRMSGNQNQMPQMPGNQQQYGNQMMPGMAPRM